MEKEFTVAFDIAEKHNMEDESFTVKNTFSAVDRLNRNVYVHAKKTPVSHQPPSLIV